MSGATWRPQGWYVLYVWISVVMAVTSHWFEVYFVRRSFHTVLWFLNVSSEQQKNKTLLFIIKCYWRNLKRLQTAAAGKTRIRVLALNLFFFISHDSKTERLSVISPSWRRCRFAVIYILARFVPSELDTVWAPRRTLWCCGLLVWLNNYLNGTSASYELWKLKLWLHFNISELKHCVFILL